jgi:hypothetical protein
VSRADTRSTHLDTTLFSIQRGRSRLSSQSGLNNFDDQLGQPRRCARGREREALATSITHHHPILSTQTEKKTPHDRCSPGHQSTRSPFQLDQPIPCGNLDQPGRYVRDRKWEAPAASTTPPPPTPEHADSQKTPHDFFSRWPPPMRPPLWSDLPTTCGHLDQPGRYVRDRKREAPAASTTPHHPLLSTQTHKKRHTTFSQDNRRRRTGPSGSIYPPPGRYLYAGTSDAPQLVKSARAPRVQTDLSANSCGGH